MKIVVNCVCVFLLFCACKREVRQVELKDLVFRCTVTDAGEQNLKVVINGREQTFPIQERGLVEIKVPQIVPQYSSVAYGRKNYSIYITGGEPVEMKISGDPDNWKREFNGGCKAINEYLSSGIESFDTDYYAKNEKELQRHTKDLIKSNVDKMMKCALPDDFVAIEKERLCYEAYGKWSMYRMYHRWKAMNENFEPDDSYYKTMEKLAKENVKLYSLLEYRNFVKKAIDVFVNKGSEEKKPDQLIRDQMKYIGDNYKDSLIVSDLMHHFIHDYVKNHGVKNAEDIVVNYKKYVKDPVLLDEFDKLCFTWEHLQPGMPSPTFNYMNTDGKNVSLESLRGKHIFIDLWASWCGPCRREIPFLQKLEKTFAGKDIVFVSISCDSNEDAWRKGMKEENMEGVQLYINGDTSFIKAYLVSGIPRFILLDKEGNIVNANMTAPSQPETEKFLYTFLN